MGGEDCVASSTEPEKQDTSQTQTTEKSNEQEQQPEKEAKKRKAMASRSEVWDSFIKITVGGELKRAQCKYCSRELKCSTKTNGTSSMKYHLNTCKKNPNKHQDNQGTLQLQPSEGDSSIGTVSTWKFDPDDLRNSFAEMLIEDELPFVFTERPGFRKFMAKACPRFTLPCRKTATRGCVKVYDVQKESLKSFFRKNCERVCITTDTWTSNTQQNYMCVTAHFIDNDWKLHKKIIGFFLVKGHRGEDIGKSLERCLAEWGIDKVFTITVDNASANNGAIKYMKRVLNESNNSIAGGEYLHMRCAAHIINLIVSEGLKEIDVSVARVRAAVKFLKGSPSRLVKFKKCAELAKVDSKAFLRLDICTRWNSTYLMLSAAIPYAKAFERYSDEDPYFKLDLEGDKSKSTAETMKNFSGVPEKKDWENAKKMGDFLEHFYELTLRVSCTKSVTSNTLFHEIADVLLPLREWCDSSDKTRKEMGTRMLDKYYKYWGDNNEGKPGEKGEPLNLVVFFCVAIDPRYKFSNYIKMATLEMFGIETGLELWDKVNHSFRALFDEYRNIYAPSDKAQSSGDSQGHPERSRRLMRSLISQKMRLDSGASKSELDKYLAEEIEEDKDFDILEWWKDNANRFPILSRMARDLLAVPVSTVVSESAFSTGGRVLDDFRSSLTPEMVERLICTQDWIQSKVVSVEEDPEELAKLEEALIEELAGLAVSSKSKSKSVPSDQDVHIID